MYSDLFDQLGGGSSSRNANRDNSNNSGPAPVVSFKAGRIDMELKNDSNTYRCTANPTRGEVRLVWNDSQNNLQWQWYDRRDQKVLNTQVISTAADHQTTFERISLNDKVHENDRIYVWTRPKGFDEQKETSYELYWMQSADANKEDELVEKVNGYLSDPKSAAPPSGTTAAATSVTSTATTSSSDRTGGQQSQVDALSSILENLGMPQSSSSSAASATAAPSSTTQPTPAAAAPNRLTLADLQGAMASVQQQQQQQTAGPSLSDVVTSEAISELLQHDDVRQRLISHLPPEQQTLEHLEDNLRSAQVQQTLRQLTAAVRDTDGLASVMANFNLDTTDNVAPGNNSDPIQVLLDAILKSVQEEKEGNEEVEEEAAMEE